MCCSADGRCESVVAAGLRLRLKVRPRSRRSAIEGLAPDPEGAALKVAVKAPPEDGKANAAMAALLAEAFGVAKSAVSVVAGATGRRKLVEIRGNPAALSMRLAEVLRRIEKE
jgi:uncharacterized protein (TIGR00251 family)